MGHWITSVLRDSHSLVQEARSANPLLSSLAEVRYRGQVKTQSQPVGKVRFIFGDNLVSLTALIPSFASKIDLVYLDPPFYSAAHYRANTKLSDVFLKTQNKLEQNAGGVRAYSDTWSQREEYLTMLCTRVRLCRELLSPSGSLYVHLDWHASHYVKILLDEIFGEENFLSEIVWTYGLGGSSPRYWPRKHDVLLWYAKDSSNHFFEPPLMKATSQRMAGKLKKIPDVWTDIPSLNNQAKERTGYPTQKPLALLDRIISSSCPPQGLVLDPFCGSGTTLISALRLGRDSIGLDQSELSKNVVLARCKELGISLS